MRITATETTKGVVIGFSNSPVDGQSESVAIRHSEVQSLTIEEAIALVHRKLVNLMPTPENVEPVHGQSEGPKGIVETEIIDTGRSTQVEEFELEGDEDDEDLSLFEVVIESPAEYLAGKGII